MDIQFVGDLQRIEAKPGDVFVVTTEQKLCVEQAEAIREWASKALNGAPVLVMGDGFKLGIVNAAAIAGEEHF
jgi:hypothetical protein